LKVDFGDVGKEVGFMMGLLLVLNHNLGFDYFSNPAKNCLS
jgi:hypothetical protein